MRVKQTNKGECMNTVTACEYLLKELMDLQGYETLEEAQEYYDENYRGEYASLADCAEDFLNETGGLEGVADWLKAHIDYEGIGKDWEIGGDIFTIELGYRKVHVFSNV